MSHSASPGRVVGIEHRPRPDQDVGEHRLEHAHDDDVDQHRAVAEPRGLRQRADQRQPHREAEGEEAGVLGEVQQRAVEDPLVERREVPEVEVERPDRQRDRAGCRARRSQENGRRASSGCRIGPVSPSAISRPARSPISRCWTMWATTISSATSASGGRSATSSSTIPAPNETWRQTSTGVPRVGQRPHPPRVGHRDRDQQQRRARVDQRVHARKSYSQRIRLKKRKRADDRDRHHRRARPSSPRARRARACGSKFIPQIEARKVGTAMIAAQAEIVAHDLVLLHAEQRQVGLEDRGQELALGGDLLVDAAGVVGDVAEVAAQLLVHVREGAALDRLQRRQQRRRPRGGTRSPRA